MKKISLILIGILIAILSLQVIFQFRGGVLGAVRKVGGAVYTQIALWRNDPGQCSFIGSYLGGRADYLRDKCVLLFTSGMEEANDCGTLDLMISPEEAQNMTLPQYYRQECLINHYKRMLGNTVVKNWLPETCTNLADRLIVMNHHFAEMRKIAETAEIYENTYEPLSRQEAQTIEKCESFLDTPRIYSFLRGESTPAEEAYYIEEQKKKIFSVE